MCIYGLSKIVGVHYNYPEIISFQFIPNWTYHNKLKWQLKITSGLFKGLGRPVAHCLEKADLNVISGLGSLGCNCSVWNKDSIYDGEVFP